MKDLSIIILNYNTEELVINCVRTITQHTKGIDYEIIIADNGSRDDSFKLIKKRLSKTTDTVFVDNKENVGFGTGNHLATKVAKGRVLLFLNSDCLLEDNSIAEVYKWQKKRSDVGIVTCALKSADGTFQSNGGFLPNLLNVTLWMFFIDDLPVIKKYIKSFHPGLWFFGGLSEPTSLEWVTGAFMMIPNDVYQKSGGFDKDYFMYMEDVDLSKRISELGKKIWYLPKRSVVHLGGASSSSEFTYKSELKSLLIYFRKHKTDLQAKLVRIIIKTGVLLRTVVFPDKSEIYKNVFKAL